MTRPECLEQLVAEMSPPTRAEIVRAALRGFSADEHAEWMRMQNARRQREFKDRARAKSNESKNPPIVTGQEESNDAPEGATVTSGAKSNGCHDGPAVTAASPAPQVSPCPPSSPVPPSVPVPPNPQTGSDEGRLDTPPPAPAKPAAGRAPGPETVPIPAALAAVAQFRPVWLQFIESRRLIRQPMTYLAAERLLVRFAERPEDAVEAVNLCIEKQWQGFGWRWFDDQRAEAAGTVPLSISRPRSPQRGKPMEARTYTDTDV